MVGVDPPEIRPVCERLIDGRGGYGADGEVAADALQEQFDDVPRPEQPSAMPRYTLIEDRLGSDS